MDLMEIMAPAGSLKSCLAAVRADADSVYLGFGKINARRPAENFDQPALKKITAFLHEMGKRVYLALNVDLKSKELFEALQILTLCAGIGVDAVIVKDPALMLLFERYFQGAFELHLSTQTAITSSFGARFARSAGAHRIVLARELTLEEIRCISPVVETEIFTEGSMCFSISGRCLMSSWVGGRSGNRGACTAPCRINWEHQGQKLPLFSMKDMTLVNQLARAGEAGVKALKIEGRLKNAAWVEAVTRLYKKALAGSDNQAVIDSITEELKQYSARERAGGHLYGHKNLTGSNREWEGYNKNSQARPIDIPEVLNKVLRIEFSRDEAALVCLISYETVEKSFSVPLPSLPKKAKTVPLELISENLESTFADYSTVVCWNLDDIQVKSSQFSKIEKKILAEVNGVLNSVHKLPVPGVDTEHINTCRIHSISADEIKGIKGIARESKRSCLLGDLPDRLIITSGQIASVLGSSYKTKTVVVQVAEQMDVKNLHGLADKYELILSIPDVLFEDEAARINSVVTSLINEGFSSFEANSLTGMQILSDKECTKHAGPWYPVLNHMAAEFFHSRGYSSVYGAVECEASVYKALSAFTKTGLNVLAFGRLPLFISRAYDDAFKQGALFKDRLGIEIECFPFLSLNYFVSTRCFSLLGKQVKNENIRVDSSAADLRYCANPVKILSALEKGDYQASEENSFNFFSKLV